MNLVKVCTKCKLEKSSFFKDKQKKDGYSSWCKDCTTANHKVYDSHNKDKKNSISKEWHKRNHAADREYTLKTKFGITSENYDEMLSKQKDSCAICGSLTIGRKNTKYFMVDHCHTTGKVRGLLCDPCNKGLGHFKDDIKLLAVAIEYLKKTHETKET